MQLILNPETDIDIQRKMSTIEEETFDGKFSNKILTESVEKKTTIDNNESIKKNVMEISEENGNEKAEIEEDDVNNHKDISNENPSEINNEDEIEISGGDSNECSKENVAENNKTNVAEFNEIKVTEDKEISIIEHGEVNIIEDKEIVEDSEINAIEGKEINIVEDREINLIGDKEISIIEDSEVNAIEEKDINLVEDREINIIEEKETEEETDKSIEVEHDEKHTDLQTNEENEYETFNGEKECKINISSDEQDNTSEVRLKNKLPESDDDDLIKIPIEKECENNKKIKSDAISNEDIISILDEKEEECAITMSNQEIVDVENQTETLLNKENDVSDKLSTNETNNVSIEKNDKQEKNCKSSSEETILDSSEDKVSDKVFKETNSTKLCEQEALEKKTCNNNIKDAKKLSHICKLSNTLDILSDEEEEPTGNETQSESKSVDKQCVTEEDDDVMLIDEDTTVKDDDETAANSIKPIINDEENKEIAIENLTNEKSIEEKEAEINKSNENIEDFGKPKEEEKCIENKAIQKPLLPVNFLKSCKKNLADMTRDELEQFCILKIVESVVDRSNLSEMKSQLKMMAQTVEESKKKAQMISKQNRDLQVVLKSVQEEQKKKSSIPITPLKITRSVGIQVLMTENITARKKTTITNNSQNNINSNNTLNRLIKSPANQSLKSPKTQINASNSQQIPVPRLVPAVNNTGNNKMKVSPAININKDTGATCMPNGIKNAPLTPKPEKRPFSKMQGNSDTVDLTDDDPPPKMLLKNVNPPVRLVSPQNLLAPQRQPFGTTISSPRKVYIPISGSQNQVRPGHAIMLKPIAPGPRPRVPPILPKPNALRTRVNNRHPPPLPDCFKQYQARNWKALPPAPELKLSKVENGIVISWKIDGYQEENHEEIASYQLYAYQETSSTPNTSLWNKIGDVKALPLPMACTLTQFMPGYRFHFAVRAVDIRSRLGPFSTPNNIYLD